MQKNYDLPLDKMVDQEMVNPGWTACQGCGAALSMKIALNALGPRTVMVIPACCACVFIGGYPYSSLKVPVIHCPFASAGVVASGAAAALDVRRERDTAVVVWAGDGGTFDIGMQSMSGAAERNENILYVCYDNEAYMNTGIQRSSATPLGAWTTTTPAESVKEERKKDIEKIMLSHHVSYMATASAAYPDDMYRKFQTARNITGFKFIHLLASCPPGWRIDSARSVQVMRLATQTNVFPLYEVRKWRYNSETRSFEENWDYTLNVRPPIRRPVGDYLNAQGRFKQMTEDMVEDLQVRVDRKWNMLLEKSAQG